MRTKETVYCEFLSKTDEFVKQKLLGYDPKGIGGKTIHDPIWGSIYYYPWEMQIIDSPLFQRLRDIKQVGLAVLTYPSARHSRFEHSLGTVAIASKMIQSIMERKKERPLVTQDNLYKIRLAALVHDIGHCFYSHLSETVYEKMTTFCELKSLFKRNKNGIKPKAHEILSYLIINTPSFIDFFINKIDYPSKPRNISNFMIEIGNMIIGYNNTSENGNTIYSYMTSIINGTFDADKLDYIKRDSYISGLALTYDVERLLYKIDVHEVISGDVIDYRLVVDISGVTAIEELTFSKIMLFSYIYHHHKVLISEDMVKDLIYGIISLRKFEHPVDFLYYTDSELEQLAHECADSRPFPTCDSIILKDFTYKIKNRYLPKRCFEISQRNIKMKSMHDVDNKAYKDNIKEFIRDYFEEVIRSPDKKDELVEAAAKEIASLSDTFRMPEHNLIDKFVHKFKAMSHKELLEWRKEFYIRLCNLYEEHKMNVEFSVFDIHIVIPDRVNYAVSDDKCVLTRDAKILINIDDFVKLKDWADAFNSNKWRGYVFVSNQINTDLAFQVAKELIIGEDAEIINPSAYIKNLSYNN